MKKLIKAICIKAFGVHPYQAKGTIKTTGISTSTCPKSFEEKFPHWDKNKFENIKYVD